MGPVSVIDGEAMRSAVDRLRSTETYASTGDVDDATREHLNACITRGMRWLDDTVGPQWDAEVDVDNLNLGSPCGCVLGQVIGNFYDACMKHGHAVIDATGIVTPDWPWAQRHGFAVTSSLDFESWDVLTALWQQRIVARRILAGLDGQVVATAAVEQDLVDA